MDIHIVDLALPRQMLVEHEIVAHVIGALRVSMDWDPQGVDLTRKLATLRFVGQSLQRHVRHVMDLEEQDGYMAVVVESRPELSEEIEALRQEHAQFRKALRRVLTRLRRVQPSDHLTFSRISQDLRELLEQLDAHSKKETDLIQYALLREDGGEG